MGTWETVRNLIVKIDSTSRISDEFKQRKLRASGAAAGIKACRACGKKGHMAAACTVPKSQLKCKFCETEKSHNTAACLKKKKNDKKKDDDKGGKTDKTVVKTPSQDRRDNSNTNKRDLSQPRSNRSPQRFGAPCAQVKVFEKGDTPPEDSSDSDEDDEYNTPPETFDTDEDLEDDDPNAPEKSDSELSEDEETDSRPNSTDPSDHKQIRLEHNYSLIMPSCVSPIPTSSSPVNYS